MHMLLVGDHDHDDVEYVIRKLASHGSPPARLPRFSLRFFNVSGGHDDLVMIK